MTALEKQKIAGFLDTASGFLGSGYHSEKKEYQFNDDNVQSEKKSDESATSIEEIASQVKICTSCALFNGRINAAPGEGCLTPLIMVIGEGPGEEEDKQGRPFVGKAGQLLDKMLEAVELSRNTNCFIANIVKCRPPANRDPLPEEAAACAHFLEKQIMLLNPKIILVLGRVAIQTLLKTSDPLGKLRGKFTQLVIGNKTYPIFATYHPSALLRDEKLKRPAWEDLKLLRSRLDEINGVN